MIKIIKYVMVDILRSKVIIAFTLVLFIISLSIFNLEDNAAKGLLSLLNIILLIVPLVSLIFSVIYMYNSAEFVELLVSQPIKRTKILLSFYIGVCCSLLTAFLIGVGIPAIVFEGSPTAYMMTLAGILLTCIFVSLAILGSVVTRDKAKGIGIGVLMWLYFTLIYDGLLLLAMFQFSDYPLEKPMMIFCSLNPVDLARVFILLKMDIAALMGYTGAIFSEFFGTLAGIIYAVSIILLWIIVPMLVALKKFKSKDL